MTDFLPFPTFLMAVFCLLLLMFKSSGFHSNVSIEEYRDSFPSKERNEHRTVFLPFRFLKYKLKALEKID